MGTRLNDFLSDQQIKELKYLQDKELITRVKIDSILTLNKMKGKFFTVDYIPNKLVYVYDITPKEILFLAFFKDPKDTEMKAHKHSANKKLKSDFKPYKNTPIQSVLNLIKL